MSYKDVAGWVDKYARNAANAAPDYVKGATSTDKDPTALAVAAKDKWSARLAEQGTKDKYARRLAAAGKNGWLQGVKTKGNERYASGVNAAKPKVQAFATQFSQHLSTALPTVHAMASTTYEQRKQRAIAMMDANHGFKFS